MPRFGVTSTTAFSSFSPFRPIELVRLKVPHLDQLIHKESWPQKSFDNTEESVLKRGGMLKVIHQSSNQSQTVNGITTTFSKTLHFFFHINSISCFCERKKMLSVNEALTERCRYWSYLCLILYWNLELLLGRSCVLSNAEFPYPKSTAKTEK